MTHNQTTKELSEILGKEQAAKLVKLTDDFNEYLLKFKTEMNEILKSHGYEVKTGFVVQPLRKD